MRKLLLVTLFLLPAFLSMGQNVNVKNQYKKGNHLGFHFTFYDFKTAADLKARGVAAVLNEGQWNNLSRQNPGLGLSYTSGLSDHLDLSARLGGANLNYPVPGRSSTAQKVLLEADASLRVKLLTDKYAVVPFFTAGIGAYTWGSYTGAYNPLGFGIQGKVFDDALIHIQAEYRNPITTSTTTGNLFYGIGISGSIGKKKVEVITTPEIPVVSDKDSDGVPDASDKCPDVAGSAKYQGCPVPDSDKDGVNDDQDICPQVPGLPKYSGCPIPDSDKDGFNDEQDKCPLVPGVAKYEGCPIPDTDGDGLNNETDRCPDIFGILDNEGCPAISFSPDMVTFITGSDKLTLGAKKELTKLAQLMNVTYPNIKVSIEGHTDNIGGAALNKKLSDRRAKSVVNYLISKKVSADRLSSSGFGMDQPIADNKSAAGRASNRRVVFRVSQYK